MTVNGSGGATTGNSNIGVSVNFPSTSTITSSGGNVSVTATGGGTGVSSTNVGVYVDEGTISAGGSGTVTVVGTHGDVGGTGNSNVGIEVSGAVGTPGIVTSNSGDISLNGQGAGTTGYGVYLNIGNVTAPGAHDVTITSSSVYGSGLISSTSGSIDITATVGGIQASASTGGAGTISLSAASAGIGTSLNPFYVSGNLDATTSGNGNEFFSTTGSVTIDPTGLNAASARHRDARRRHIHAGGQQPDQ